MGARSGNYSRLIFDEVKRYGFALFQQNTEFSDADINDALESLHTLSRRITEFSVGNGSPFDTPNMAFEVLESTSPLNNFKLKGGDGTTEGAGRIFNGGFHCILPSDTEYRSNNEEIHAPIVGLSDTVLTDTAAKFIADELVGRDLTPDISAPATVFPILANSETTITVAGGLLAATSVGQFYRVELSTPNANLSEYTIDFITTSTLPDDGKIVVEFPTGTNINSITNTDITSSDINGTFTVGLLGETLTVTRNGDGTPTLAGSLNIIVDKVINPNVGSYSIHMETQDSLSTTIDEMLASTPYNIVSTAGLSSIIVTPASSAALATTSYFVQFDTNNTLPSDGRVVIEFPRGTDLSGVGGVDVTSTTVNGTFTATFSGTTLTIDRAGGGGLPEPNGTIDFTVADIVNPVDGRYAIHIQTQDGLGAPIEGFDVSPTYTIGAGAGLLAITVSPDPSTPGSVRTDTVYLDSYLDEIDSVEDETLLHQFDSLVELARRAKVRQIIRIAEGPFGSPDDKYVDFDGNVHRVLVLAELNRPDGKGTIETAEIENKIESVGDIASIKNELATARLPFNSLDERLDDLETSIGNSIEELNTVLPIRVDGVTTAVGPGPVVITVDNVIPSGTSGAMTGADKQKLDDIEAEANKTHTGLDTLDTGAVVKDSVTNPGGQIGIRDTEGLTWTGDDTTNQIQADLELATGLTKGALSATDFTKLGGVETGANRTNTSIDVDITLDPTGVISTAGSVSNPGGPITLVEGDGIVLQADDANNRIIIARTPPFGSIAVVDTFKIIENDTETLIPNQGNFNRFETIDFDDGTGLVSPNVHGVGGQLNIPSQFVTPIDVKIQYVMSGVGPGDVKLEFKYQIAEFDQVATTDVTDTITITPNSVAQTYETKTITTIPITDYEAGEDLHFEIRRFAHDAEDTHTADFRLISLSFEAQNT